MRLFLARHGNTDWTEAGRIQGSTDIPLNELGRESAQRLAQELSAFKQEISLVISSDLMRASETAKIVSAHLAKPLLLDARLREASFGTIEGMTKEESLQAHGSVLDRNLVEWDFRPFGGENKESLLKRHLAAIEEHRLGLLEGTTLLLVGHGRSLSTLTRYLGQHENFKRPASWISIDVL